MQSKWMFVVTVLILASLLLAPAAPVSAQDPQPPTPPVDPSMPTEVQDPELDALGLIQRDGYWVNEGGMLLEPEEERIEAQASFSRADKFGYRYQKVTPGWIDAYGEGDRLQGEDFAYFALDLPFTFSFYGYDFTSLKVSEYGYLTFSNEEPKQKVSQLADPTQPNNIIAPYWAAVLSSDGVYQISGGDAPNRWMAIEWPNMYEQSYEGSGYTFEVVLYESGEIWFQYEVMQYSLEGYRCGTAGIEDQNGRTALVSSTYCKKITSNTAVRIVPPGPSGRVSVEPPISGGLGIPGGMIEHRVRVDNPGDMGSDVYDLALSSRWPGVVYAADGFTPLTDTDGDKKIDTGPVEEGAGVTVVIKITIPLKYKVGNRSDATLKFTSSVNRKKTASAKLENAVSADFAQTYSIDHQAQVLRASSTGLTNQAENEEFFVESNPGVVETTSGRLVRAWIGNRCLNEVCDTIDGTGLYYRVFEHNGTQVSETHLLEDLSTHTSYLYRDAVSTAAGPDGSVGFAYVKYSPTEDGSAIYNLYYAAIDSDGAILVEPVSVTQNETPIYDPFEDRNSGPRFDKPNLSYTADEHIIFSWEQSSSPGGAALDDIYTAVMDEDCTFIQNPRKLTNDTGDASGYLSPTVTNLMNNKALIAWSSWLRSGTTKFTFKYFIQYAVVDSAGTIRKQSSIKTGINAAGIDAAQMAGGEIVLAWTSGIINKTDVYYAIVNGKSYTKTKGPISLKHTAAFKGVKAVSVTTDTLNHAILTWAGTNNSNLYYALLGKNGTVLTKPLLFLQTPAQSVVHISSTGQGVTTYGIPRPVTVTLTATVPSTTDASGKTVYLAGNFNDWNPSALPMTRVDKTHWKITLVVNERYPMLYKYSLGDWEHVEKGKKCVEINDRVLDVQYGTAGTMKKSDTVSAWRNVLPCTGD